MRAYGIIELVRSGRIAMVRSGTTLQESSRGQPERPVRIDTELVRLHYLEPRSEPTTHARQDLLRQRRGPVAAEGQDDRHSRLRIAGTRPSPEPPRQRLQGHHRANCPAAPTTTWPSNTASSRSRPRKPTQQGDLINILLPDEIQGDVYRQHIAQQLQPGNILMCSHGFNIHFGQIEPPPGRRYAAGRPQGPRPPGAQRVRQGRRRALPDRRQRRRQRPKRLQLGPGLRQGHRRHARRRHPDHLRRRDRDRPVRRAGGAVRRRERAGQGRPSRRWSRPATSPKWPTSSACTN